jgi:uncharacterized phiE125 gp8 family phage protein
MQLKVLSENISEPVTVDEVKSLMGYTLSDQDALIAHMIRVAREWLENRTAVSLVNKQYKAYFEKTDRVGGWYELPMSPVRTSPAIVVEVCGISSDFDQKGMDEIKIRPYDVSGSIRIGATTEIYYVEVTFNAGEKNETGNKCIKRIVLSMFNQRDDNKDSSGTVAVGRLPFDTLRLIESFSRNTGL